MRKLQVHGFRHVDDRRTCHAPLVCGVYEYARGTFHRGCFAVQSSEESASRQTESMSIPLSTPSSISATTDGESLSTPDCSRTTEENDQPSDMRVVEASVTNITATPRVVIVEDADGARRDTVTDPLAPQEKTTTTTTTTTAKPPYNVGAWSTEEHARYLKAMASATRGIRKWSWKEIAQQIGTRSTRQVMTHHQKYLAKQRRHQSQHLQLPPQSPPDNLSILVLASTTVSDKYSTCD